MSELLIRQCFPEPAQVRELPAQLEFVVPPDWEDRNGHVNVQFYLTLFELGGWVLLDQLGFDEVRLREHHFSFFDLEHHLNYLAEIAVGERLTTYNRVVGVSGKRFHAVYFVVNESRDRLAATLEYVSNGVDMRQRRTAAMPGELAAGLGRICAEHRKLGWEAPLCGVMAP